MPGISADVLERVTAPSLAGDMEARQVWTNTNPKYQQYTEALVDKLRAIYERDAMRSRSASPVPVVQTLDTMAQHAVAGLYPEFAPIWLHLDEPVHARYAAMRSLANEWMRVSLRRTVETMTHVGDNLVATAFAGDRGVQFEVDASNVNAMHEAHRSSVNFMRLASDPQGMKEQCGYTIPPDIAADFFGGKVYSRVTGGREDFTEREGLAVDGTMYPVTVHQVLAMMMQASAVVAEVVIPFHPLMLQVPEGGELPGTGVHYEVTSDHLLMKYPEGVAGVTRYDLTTWHEWLAATHRSIEYGPERPVFRFELRKPRGCFLHVSIVRVPDGTPAPERTLHTLEFCDVKGKTILNGWRYRGLGMDPHKETSWESFSRVYDQTTVDKIYELALSLPVNELHVSKLVSRATAIGRAIVSSTGVETRPSLTADEVRDLCVQVHAMAFAHRFETGTVVGQLKERLDELCGFSSLSRGRRFAYLLSTFAAGIWSGLVGDSVDRFRAALDTWRDWFKPRPAASVGCFTPVPAFVTMETSASTWLTRWKKHVSKLRAEPSVVFGLKGSLVASFVDVGPPVKAAGGLAVGMRTGEDVVDYEDMRAGDFITDEVEQTTRAVGGVADLARESEGFHVLEMAGTRQIAPTVEEYTKKSYIKDPDFVGTLSEFHESIFPGFSGQNFSHDEASMHIDPQDRALATDFLTLPVDVPRLPADRRVYKSKVQAYNREKAQQTLPGTLAALMARNMADPQLSKGQDKEVLIPAIFENFLEVACVSNAKAKLARYKAEPVSLTGTMYNSWATQAKPETLKSLRGALAAQYKAFEDRDVGEYIAMLKADQKPPLSTKPLTEHVAPQVIVYHEKVLSSLYSSLFRVLRERLLSLLKPNFRLALIKGSEEIRQFMEDNHPWDSAQQVQFLENDFSKYDKSQGEFAFMLEEYIFGQLGLNKELLERWVAGHVNCSIKAFSIGLTLHVMYQRKSGDATTALGNVILNITSVLYAYRGTDIKWAVFMGDDSLVCTGTVVVANDAPQILAEIFNLQAKFFITQHPYFASAFLIFDEQRRKVVWVPDPVKVIQRWSLSVSERDPRWDARYESYSVALDVYRYRHRLHGLGAAVRDRYAVPASVVYDFDALGGAIATAIESERSFRALYDERVTAIRD
ncbi:RNA-dependent RNA polymerase [Erysiphe necator associated virga-like virus 7]|nr:RNA-dependent RNA polymerase [Erysiphe necator associated virga-like virus 7]